MEAGTEGGHEFLDSLAAGTWIIDPDGVTTYMNRAMLDLVGRPWDDIAGRSFLEPFHPDDRRTVQEAVARRRTGASDHYDVRLLHASGREVHVRIHGAPLMLGGAFAGSIAVVTDITDLAAALRAAREGRRDADDASIAKSRFLSWVSHELRTPLNTIAGFAQLLESSLKDPGNRTMAASINTAAAHVNGLVQDLLDYSRAEAHMLEPSLETVDLRGVVDDAVVLAGGSARANQVEVRVDVPELWVVADRRHLLQAVLNLLSNAVKYGGTGSAVHVTAHSEEQRVLLAVADDGPGIAPELQQRVFRPFERLDHEGPVEGVGLGLSIADAFVRAMHGRLTLTSPPGGGATFVIDLPAGVAPGTEPSTGQPVDTAGHLVLYVEDEPLNAALVENIIGFLPGRSLHVEPTVAGGISAVQRLRPTLVLLDLNLPDGSGLDVLRVIRDTPELAATPVFILSADATEQASSRALAAGADRFITKPFNLKEFISLLETVT